MRWVDAFLDASIGGYLLATAAYGAWFLRRSAWQWRSGTALAGLGLAAGLACLTAGGLLAERPPLAAMFETLVLLACCVAGIFLAAAGFGDGWRELAPLAAAGALAATTAARLTVPGSIEPLVPALRSLWLSFHVGCAMAGYAAFLLAYAAALLYLLRKPRHVPWAALTASLTAAGALTAVAALGLARSAALGPDGRRLLPAAGAVLALAAGLAFWPLALRAARAPDLRRLLPDGRRLHRLVRSAVGLGFPLLTLGIITGSCWAHQAWGRYWGWDAKETASLVTWLVFCGYLHLRRLPVRTGAPGAWMAVAGFWLVLFTYLGVNWLAAGLHSYA